MSSFLSLTVGSVASVCGPPQETNKSSAPPGAPLSPAQLGGAQEALLAGEEAPATLGAECFGDVPR